MQNDVNALRYGMRNGVFMETKSAKGTGFYIKNIILYIICAALVIFYLAVLWLGFNPDVCLEYRMYYLTNELSDWPGYGKLPYELGTVEYCTGYWDKDGNKYTHNVCKRKGRGWEKYQNEGSRNAVDTASIYYLPISDKENTAFAFEINSFEGNKAVKVYANDELIGEFDGEGKFELTVPKVTADEMLIIRFEAGESRFRLWKACLG